jgi:uncharacterized repeat protein (TIGR01451 family)
MAIASLIVLMAPSRFNFRTADGVLFRTNRNNRIEEAPMRLRLFAGIAILMSSLAAHAAMRITDINGNEVTVARGPAKARRPAVTANARVGANANVTITAGADTDAANNDYRRIQNAINAATAGDVITLSGTFDFTAPFAAAAWALGNDNTPATLDDYSVYVPQGLNNITLTATSLGSATIQGPGDIPTVDLEGFLYFDGGDNQNWEISNLRILDFDLSIGMFFGAGGSDAFNGTQIVDNYIRTATDLNATVAPGDSFQNIAIHYAFGTNQTISNNRIDIPGNGVSASPNFASTVGMQSNTSGGAVYDGLQISLNEIHILNAQTTGNPENILGFWENAHGHTSNITVSSNTFFNDAAGNDSSQNLQRAFRITSHSSPTTTVLYSNNVANEANIGFQWLAGSNFAGNQAVLLTGGGAIGCATGVLVQSNGIAHIETMTVTGSGAGGGVRVVTGMLTGSGANPNGISNSFVSGGTGDGVWIETTAGAISPLLHNDFGGNTGFGLRNDSAPLIVAERNWWGNNLAAAVVAEVFGNVDFDPWLASGTDVSGAPGFQPFIYATTSGALTTFVGTSGVDTGALLAGDPITMQMNGQTAFTALAQLLNFSILLDDGADTFTLGQTGIPTTFDGGGGNDTLQGTNVAQTWNITGANSGNIPGATSSFINTESLRGGTAADNFVFGAAGSVAQTIDGNLGTDSLDNTAIPAATVTPTGPGTLDGFMGTATGVGAGFDNINLIVGSTDVSVAKTGPATGATNGTITYTITVTNSGPNAAASVQLDDPLPPGTTFNSLLFPAGWSCTTPASGATGTVTCTTPTMAVGNAVFTLTVNAPTTPATVSNTAIVSSPSDTSGGNNASTTNTIVSDVADLEIVKTGPPTVVSGGQITYTITVTNNGPDDATNVVVTDVLPPGTVYVSATPTQGTCSFTTNVDCTLGTILNGGTATISLIVNVTAPDGATLINTASVDSTETDPTPANAIDTATVTVGAGLAGVPTASEWALLLLALSLAMFAVVRLR